MFVCLQKDARQCYDATKFDILVAMTAQSAEKLEHVPRHTGGTGRHIMPGTKGCGASLNYRCKFRHS